MNIDTWVKLSQIATPFVLLGLGFLVSISVNKNIQNNKVTSDFNTKWSDEFIRKCQKYSEHISEMQFALFDLSEETNFTANHKKQIASPVSSIRKTIYDIKIHSSLLDDTDGILKIVDEIFEESAKNIDAANSNGYANLDIIKKLQTELNKKLKDQQRKVLEL